MNVYGVDITESIQTGVVDRLMYARERDVEYAIVLDGIAPLGEGWDKYGDGMWNSKSSFITTEDIKTPNNDRKLEEQNIYDFLRGKSAEKNELESMIADAEEIVEDNRLSK